MNHVSVSADELQRHQKGQVQVTQTHSKAVALGVEDMTDVTRTPGQAAHTSLALLAMYACYSVIFAKS